MASTIVPTQPSGPSAKEKKYDRQLRLWAASGQKALEDAHVLLINSRSGVVGIEALKNLVLPSIGQFTIVDEATVQEEDLGVNFFLTEESLGKPRAAECYKLLNELNSDVTGHYYSKSIKSLLSRRDFLKPYTLIIIATPVDPDIFDTISAHARNFSVPLFLTHCIGFYSCFSVQLPSTFPIVDTHPDPVKAQDLRILNPWPELAAEAEKYKNLESLNDHDHGHVPYIIILLHYLKEWKTGHNGEPPRTRKEKLEFRNLLKAGARADTVEGADENYDEAVAAVFKALVPPELPSTLRDIFELEESKTPTKESLNFYLIAHAMSRFYAAQNCLPLPGTLPDMKAESHIYIALQDLYRKQAQTDITRITDSIRELERDLYREVPIPQEEIDSFCRNAAHVKVIHGEPLQLIRSGQSELGFALSAKSDLLTYLENVADPSEESLFPVFLSFMAYDAFVAETGRVPTSSPKDHNLLLSILTAIVQNTCDKLKVPPLRVVTKNNIDHKTAVHIPILPCHFENTLKELERAEGCELHNIAALTGGLLAQEIIKVITKQYIPIDNCCVFDGIASRSMVFRV